MSFLPSTPADRRSALRRHLCIGVAVPAGWVLHDLAVFLTSGEPRLAWLLVPGWLVFLGAGALLAALFSVAPRLLLPAVLLVLLLPVPESWEFSNAQHALPRVIAALIAAGAATAWMTRRSGEHAVRVGLALGVLACLATTAYRSAFEGLWCSWFVLAAAVLGLGLALVARATPRRCATAAVLVACAAPILRDAWSAARLQRADRPAAVVGGEHPNLLLIVLDTVRADRLAAYGHERDTMPRLEAFMAERGVRYDQARSSSSWTLPSHASLLTGLLPGQHGATHPRDHESAAVGVGAWEARALREDVPTLAERLSAAGYRTGAIVSNSAYLHHGYGLDRGFERYDDRDGGWVRKYRALPQFADVLVRVGQLLYRDARRVTDQALAWLDEVPGERPFFLFLNYMDAHAPYLPPPPFDRNGGEPRPTDSLKKTPEEVSLAYDRELSFLDAELGRLFAEVDARGLLDDSVVVVTSDHGEALGDHGFRKHGWTLYDAVVRVPLFVKPRGTAPGGDVRNEPIGGADLHDLMLRELGLERLCLGEVAPVSSEWYRASEDSRSRWPGGRDLARDLVSWVEPPLKFIVASTGQVEAYDLLADPGETRPLELDPAVSAAALERAARWWRENPPPAGDAGAGSQDATRLKALGYADAE